MRDFCIFMQMSFLDKYPKLKERQFLTNLVTKTVYATMALEDQKVEEAKVRQIVTSLLNQQASEPGKLAS
ncbi:MAG: hypothetical protein ACO1OQ_16920 [Rufibacter sp.]